MTSATEDTSDGVAARISSAPLDAGALHDARVVRDEAIGLGRHQDLRQQAAAR
jgi:hypothetical protein